MITTETVRNRIFALAEDAYKRFSSSLIPGEETIIGVRIPVLRQYAKELYRGWRQGARDASDSASAGIDDLLKIIGDEYCEEIMLQGMIIGMQKGIDADVLFRQIDAFVPKIRNWAVCDTFCAGLKEVKKHPGKTWDFLQKYLSAHEEYHIRFGLVMLLDYYIDEAYLQDIFRWTERITHESYYVKMAAAWLLSMCFVKYYDETKAFMQSCTLDEFTYRKALQKTRESLRITAEQKAELKDMQRSGRRKSK